MAVARPQLFLPKSTFTTSSFFEKIVSKEQLPLHTILFNHFLHICLFLLGKVYKSWMKLKHKTNVVFYQSGCAQGSAVPCLSALSSPIWTSERATTCNGSAGWKHQSQQSNFANLKIGKLLKNSLLKIDLSIRYRFLLMIEAQQVFDRGFAQRKDWSLDRFTVTSFTFILGLWVWAMFHSIFRYLLFVI